MFRCALLSLLALFVVTSMLGQDPESILPKGLTEEEKVMLPFYTAPDVSGMALPLASSRGESFRTMAEWEELQAVVITWTSFQAILAEIVRAVQKECQVIIVCNNENTVKNYLAGKGVDWTINVTFLQGPFNSIWVRDYGPNTVYLNDVDSIHIVDWIYNRPRPNDDLVPFLVGNLLNVPVMATQTAPNDLVNTGGNFMSDGSGTGFSSRLVLDENGPLNNYGTSNHDEAAIDGIMNNFMGIDPYIKMTNLPYDGIHHIDMHMKLLDEETLLVGEYPAGIADGPQIEANLQYVLSNFTSVFGTPYKVVRMPMPPDATGKFPHQGGHYRTYTNSLVVNKTILVPTYAPQYDTTALRIYREAKPGYEVLGIDCNAIIPLSGALHCITKEVGVMDPLRIVHQSVRPDFISADGATIEALIQHRDGITSANVFWTRDTLEGYEALPMEPGVEPNMWTVLLPSGEEDSDIFYYIEATAGNGKIQRRPMTAPHGYWSFLLPGQPTNVESPISTEIEVSAVFPNPASALTCLPVDFGTYIGEASIVLVDVLGRSNSIYNGKVQGGERKFFFQAKDFAPGTYIIQVETAVSHSQQTLIIR